ncbi:MAG: DUF2752 domain-containing protein [Planctomycetia bacterium]|nr:DUF2752 domain-containing protein [Planctomycetia bacterium]
MLRLLPSFLCPTTLQGEKRLLYDEMVTALLLIMGGMVTGICHPSVEAGVLPGWISELPFIGHHGFVCPLCGGCRAFVFCCQGDFKEALHFSFLGTWVFACLVGTLPLKVYYFFCWKNSEPCPWLCFIRQMESGKLFLVMMIVFFLLQLFLTQSGIWVWKVLD